MVRRCLCGCGTKIQCGSYVPGHEPYIPWGRRGNDNKLRAKQAWLRKQVLARDGNTCQRCGLYSEDGKGLVAHHLEPGNDDPDRCVTLCDDCHRAVDSHAR